MDIIPNCLVRRPIPFNLNKEFISGKLVPQRLLFIPPAFLFKGQLQGLGSYGLPF